MEHLTVEDVFAIGWITVIIVGGAILWQLRGYLIAAASVLVGVGRQVFGHFVAVRRASEHTGAPSAPARSGARGRDDDAWLDDALARGAEGAGVRAEEVISPRSLVLAPDEIAAVGRMIAHNKTLAKPNKLATIQAGWPAIKNRSGDPKSQYARASAIYDQLFAAPGTAKYPPLTPEQERVRREMEIA